jgi:bacteriophage exclusion system BrxB-like protein
LGKIEDLATAYHRHVSAPWQRTLSGADRVIFVVYEKETERALRARVGEFEQATARTGHVWRLIDCSKWFSEWMARDEYREAYFETPDLLTMKLDREFKPEICRRLTAELEQADENTVVALLGVASLYPFVRVSEVVHEVERTIRGRLVVFFPGTKNENIYRLLDARDGFNYMANGITLHSEGTNS